VVQQLLACQEGLPSIESVSSNCDYSCGDVNMFQLQLFSLQLLHRKVQFTACGFFPLDFTLLHSVRKMTRQLKSNTAFSLHLILSFVYIASEYESISIISGTSAAICTTIKLVRYNGKR
jgi:hypothetical protein